jgi:hypothetical protein
LSGIGANHAVPAVFCNREVVPGIGIAFPLAALAYLATE